MVLNKEQQSLVTENHNLIYSFANKHGLDLDSYYDLLAIALCKAAFSYDESKGKFSTVAYKVMLNEVRHEIRRQKADKRKVYECVVEYSDVIGFGDEHESGISIDTQKAFCELELGEKAVINDKLKGYSNKEIMERLGVTQRYVRETLAKFKLILKGRYDD